MRRLLLSSIWGRRKDGAEAGEGDGLAFEGLRQQWYRQRLLRIAAPMSHMPATGNDKRDGKNAATGVKAKKKRAAAKSEEHKSPKAPKKAKMAAAAAASSSNDSESAMAAELPLV